MRWLTGVRPLSDEEDEALRKAARYSSAEELLRDKARRPDMPRYRPMGTHAESHVTYELTS